MLCVWLELPYKRWFTCVSSSVVGPSCSISHKISKSDSSGGEPVICDSAQHTTWVTEPLPYTNHQQHINMMSTANHSASKYRNQAQELEEKQSCKVGAHQTDNRRVGWDHQIHTFQLPRMIRNHMYTRLYQAPCQLCLTTSLPATDGISHEGPRFFTLVRPWRTSICCGCLQEKHYLITLQTRIKRVSRIHHRTIPKGWSGGVQNLKKKKKDFSGRRPAITFLYLFLFHSLLRFTSFLSQKKYIYFLY